jgi:hypothetical protein
MLPLVRGIPIFVRNLKGTSLGLIAAVTSLSNGWNELQH